ncbi:DNA polymerase [Escherichia coli]|uniref:DNA polymerase n=1 Tax=Escherichia coli TaxID=562 RepID=UPI00140B66CF|nr:DNA polymerase [Escherichia coli]NHR67528.1 hypothetical protein [Escherichia coli]
MSFLFDSFEGAKNVKPISRPIPYVRDTGWRPRAHYPDLSSAKIIGLDCETYDPGMDTNGSGWARREGHIVGVSIATDNGFKAYYPIRHELGEEDNLPAEEVLGWLRRELSRPNQVKVGANITYDLGWLAAEGVEVKGLCMDVQFAEALLDPGARVALEGLGRKYVGEGKDSAEMYQWISDAYGCKPTGEARKYIYKTPPRLVGYYAESDADLPIHIIKAQWPLLSRWCLTDVFYMECKLIPLMLKMRFAGVRVDLDKAKEADDTLSAEIRKMHQQIKDQIGFNINVNSGPDLALAFDHLGLEYFKTAAGNPSFTADFLAGLHHPFAELVSEIKSYEKIQSTFIRGYILGMNTNGFLHGQFHQMRGDDGGTVSGRFSSSDPNLQNIPSRHKILGPLLRACFVPDVGHRWGSADYAQIEYRFMAHFAVGPGADELRAIFAANPEADYHNVMVDIIKEASGHVIERKPAKTINFGLLYGMMLNALARKLAMTPEEAEPVLKAYHQGAPFIGATMKHYEDLCYSQGYVETFMGRKTWFNKWVPKRGGFGKMPLPFEEARQEYGPNIKLADTHKAINRVLQGSSADQMKSAMLKGYEDGYFDVIGVPRLTVHDELNFSLPAGKQAEDGFYDFVRVMETVLPLRVPVLTDAKIESNWAEAH